MQKTLITTLLFGSALVAMSTNAVAQSNAIACPGYEKPKTTLISQRTGKTLQSAFEAYNADDVQGAIAILKEAEPREEFDKASLNRFMGNLVAGIEGRGGEALKLLLTTVEPKILNDADHAGTLKLVADLSLQEGEYEQAIKFYKGYQSFTCKEDAKTFTRIAQAYYELKQLDKILEPANRAIELQDEPNKNPYVLKLTSFYERKMYPETVEVAETLVKTFPEEEQWWTQLGFFYMLVEDYSRALSTFEISYKKGYLEKESELKALSQLYANKGIPKKSADILEKYIDEGVFERDEDNLAALANTLHQAKDYKLAAKYYGEAAGLKNNPEYHRKQGTLLLTAEDYSGAIRALQRALDAGISSEQVAQVHFALMEANFYAGNFKRAYTHVREARKDPSLRRNANAWEPYIKEKAKNRGITI